MTQQTNAQRLADWLDGFHKASVHHECAQELRRLDSIEQNYEGLKVDYQRLMATNDQLRAQVERLQGGEPVGQDMHRWCAYVGGMVAHWIKSEPDALTRIGEDRFEAAIAGIIERRLWTMPKDYQPAAPAMVALTPEQAHNLFLSFMAEPNWTAMDWYFKGLRDSEAHHGIGQPVGGEAQT